MQKDPTRYGIKMPCQIKVTSTQKLKNMRLIQGNIYFVEGFPVSFCVETHFP